jgi:hypothetical protein
MNVLEAGFNDPLLFSLCPSIVSSYVPMERLNEEVRRRELEFAFSLATNQL